MSFTKRAVVGAVLVLMSFALLGSGGTASRSTDSWPAQHHITGVAPDINAIMATGGCKAGTPGG